MTKQPPPPNHTHQRRLLAAWCLAIAAAVMLGKLPGAPTATFLGRIFTLEDLPLKLHPHLEYLLLTPIATVAVVFFRLTLGLDVFGMWRPIILAVAFHLVGLGIGLAFLVAVMTVIVVVRPLLRVTGMHNYGRKSIVLGSVVMLLLATVAAGARTGVNVLLRVAHFPIISLCLISESFAMTLYDHGPWKAVRRGSATILAGIFISLIFSIPGGVQLLLRFPELLIAQIGCVVLIAEFGNLRLLEPKPTAAATVEPVYTQRAAEIAVERR